MKVNWVCSAITLSSYTLHYMCERQSKGEVLGVTNHPGQSHDKTSWNCWMMHIGMQHNQVLGVGIT